MIIKGVTKYACNNRMPVCGKIWSQFVCMNDWLIDWKYYLISVAHLVKYMFETEF